MITSKGGIIIPEDEYEELKRDSAFLRALEECGVDNWEGYSDAYKKAFGDNVED